METETTANIPVLLEKRFKDKIEWLVLNFKDEIAGFITGRIDKDGILCEDLLIYEQKASGGSAEVEPKSLIKLRKEFGDKCNEIIGQFHSHNTMSSFWSSDDERVIKTFSEPRAVSVFIVSSKTDGHLIRAEVRKPFFLSIDKLDFNVKNEVLQVELLEEIKKKVTKDDFNYKNTYEKEDKEYKKQANSMIKYYNKKNKVEIKELSEQVFEQLVEEFQYVKMDTNKDSFGDYKIQARFKKKSEALDFIRDVRKSLIIFLEFDDVGLSTEKDSNILTYEEANQMLGT